MACGPPASAFGSGLEVLGEPVRAALPAVRGCGGIERWAVVGKEGMPRSRLDHDLDVGVVHLDELAKLPRVCRRRARVRLAVEAKERRLDVLSHVEPADR